MLFNFLVVFSAIFFIWLIVLTFLFWNINYHYNKLTRGVTDKSLRSVLENILRDLNLAKVDLEKLKEYTDKIQKGGLFHIQKVGLVRFNPFKDTGGDQSFILSLIDGKDTGVVISALYSRSGTRWYVKKVVEGKGVEHELSEEEKRSIIEARS